MRLFLFCYLLCFSFSFGQETDFPKHSIQLNSGLFSTNRGLDNSTGLDYRFKNNDKFSYTVGLNYARFNSKTIIHNMVIHSSDSLIIQRTTEGRITRQALNLGFQYDLFGGVFIGSQLNIGYAKEKAYSTDNGLEYLEEYDRWENCAHCVYEFHGVQQVSDQSSMISPRPLTSVSDIGEYFLMSLQLQLGYTHSLFKNVDLTLRYLPEYAFYQGIRKTSTVSDTYFHHHINFSIGYQF